MHTNAFGKHPCPCCGFFTLDEKPDNTFQLCPVCLWEDDGIQLHDPDYEGGANTMSLHQAKENYRTFGAVEERVLEFVRQPLEEEML